MKSTGTIMKCKRCNKPTQSEDRICQECKNDLLSHYEVSLDWQTAFEIEKAQIIASRYRSSNNLSDDLY